MVLGDLPQEVALTIASARAPFTITAPFEPLQSVEFKFLSMKTLPLTVLASIKRVGDLQAFSVDDSCFEFGPADSSATLRPDPAMCPRFLPLPSGTR